MRAFMSDSLDYRWSLYDTSYVADRALLRLAAEREARAILAETEPEVYGAETWDLSVFKRANLKYHFLLAEAMGDASIWDADPLLPSPLLRSLSRSSEEI